MLLILPVVIQVSLSGKLMHVFETSELWPVTCPTSFEMQSLLVPTLKMAHLQVHSTVLGHLLNPFIHLREILTFRTHSQGMSVSRRHGCILQYIVNIYEWPIGIKPFSLQSLCTFWFKKWLQQFNCLIHFCMNRTYNILVYFKREDDWGFVNTIMNMLLIKQMDWNILQLVWKKIFVGFG